MKGRNVPFKKNMIQGGSIVLAALVVGLCIVSAVRVNKSFENTVTVRGLCEREVPADRVIYRINYSCQSNSLTEIRQTLRQNNALIVELLRKAGIDEDEIKYTPASVMDRYNGYYNTDNISYRYGAEQNINVFTTNLDVVKQLQNSLESDLLNHDVIVNAFASYEYRGLNDIKPSMIAESLENARVSAEEFAKNSHSRIGKMRTASQGYFTVDDLDENTPQLKNVRVVTKVEYYLK